MGSRKKTNHRKITTHYNTTKTSQGPTSSAPPRVSNIRNNTAPSQTLDQGRSDIHQSLNQGLNQTNITSGMGSNLTAYGMNDNIPLMTGSSNDDIIKNDQIYKNAENLETDAEDFGPSAPPGGIEQVGELPQNILREGTTHNKEKGYFEHTVNFKNLHGNDKITSLKVRTKTKSSAQEIRMLGAMKLQKDPMWQERTKAAGIGNSYVHGSQNKKWMKKGNATNAQSFHGNTFNHMTNAAGDYIKLSSDGRVGMNKADPKWTEPSVDKNKNPKFVKRDSGYAPPTYGDRGLPGIGTLSRTGFVGGKRGDDPFKFNPPTGRKGQTLKKVTNSRGLPQWIGGLKQTPENTTKTYKRQVNKEAVGKKRVKKGVIVGAKSRYNEYKQKRRGTVPMMGYMDTNNIYKNNMPDYSINKQGGSQKEKVEQRRKELETENFLSDYLNLDKSSY